MGRPGSIITEKHYVKILLAGSYKNEIKPYQNQNHNKTQTQNNNNNKNLTQTGH